MHAQNAARTSVTCTRARAHGACSRARGACSRSVRSCPSPPLQVASLSGLFFASNGGHASVADATTPFVTQVRRAVAIGQMRFPTRCEGRWPATERWRCFLGVEPLEALPADLPVFAIQSRLDLWQTSCVLGLAPSRFSEISCAAEGGWARCLSAGGVQFKPLVHSRKIQSSCSGRQWRQLAAFEVAAPRSIQRALTSLDEPLTIDLMSLDEPSMSLDDLCTSARRH